VRRTDFWERLEVVVGPAYATSWAADVVLTDLGVTVMEAFEKGIETRDVWRAVCRTIEVPSGIV
jgi:hypothetical protein